MKALRYLAVLPALALAAVAFGPAAQAQQPGQGQGQNQQQRAVNIGGLIDAIIQVQDVLNNANILNDSNIQVVNVERSLNGNQVNVLRDILNNSEVLSRNVTTLQNFLNNNDIDVDIQDVDVLSDNQIEILENANINIDDVVGVDILDGGDFLVFVD